MELFLASLVTAFVTAVGKDAAAAAETTVFSAAARLVASLRQRLRGSPGGEEALQQAAAHPESDADRKALVELLREQLDDESFRAEVVQLLDEFRTQTGRQVAAVCHRGSGSELELMLVRTGGGKRWTFPKGNPDPGETEVETAVRRARIEGGARGSVDPTPLADYLHLKRERAVSYPVRPYLVEVLVAGTSKQGREIVWCTPARAKELLAERREPEWALGLAAVVDEAVERLRRAA